MKQSRPIEVIHPTRRHSVLRSGMPLANMLTIGAALLVVILSVSLSRASNTDTCARPIDAVVSMPCDYR